MDNKLVYLSFWGVISANMHLSPKLRNDDKSLSVMLTRPLLTVIVRLLHPVLDGIVKDVRFWLP